MSLTRFRILLCGATFAIAAASSLPAQKTDDAPPAAATEQTQADPEAEAARKVFESLDWKTEGAGALGSIAEIQIPAGYTFTGSSGTIKLMELMGNLTNGSELGYIAPENMDWFAVSSSARSVT